MDRKSGAGVGIEEKAKGLDARDQAFRRSSIPGPADGRRSHYNAMFRVTVVVWVTPPPFPVIVTVLFPVLAPALTITVIVDFPDPGAAMDEGLKLTVTPDGRPDADNAIAALKPPETVAVILEVPEPPQASKRDVGEALMVKLPPAPADVTVSVTVAVWVALPLVPVTVIG